VTEPSVFERIRALLDASAIEYRVVEHGPTRTSEEAAAARGEPLRLGGKALMLRVDGAFRLLVLSAASKLDSAAVKRHFGARKTRFATRDELLELTGLVPGSVPPFGAPILAVPLYVDAGLCENERIAFNAGSLTASIVMAMPDYLAVADPDVFRFAAES
jgi:prolyl-tRNA editing enzyme YbaK/EbsC (Cys-tRNA(Pro) deacylase)